MHRIYSWLCSWFVAPDCGGHCGPLPHCGCSGPHCGCSGRCLVYEHSVAQLWRIWRGHFGDWLWKRRRPNYAANDYNRRYCAKVVVGRPRVAYVSLYGTACGISTYNEELLSVLHKDADIHVFAEYGDDRHSTNIDGDPHWVTRCWDRREHPKSRLLKEIEAFNPEIVHIGHEYGFFPAAYQLTNLISSLKLRGYPVIMTLHSVYEHDDKTVQEMAADYLVVHTEEAKAVLVSKGLEAHNISVIPHGTQVFAGTPQEPELLPPLWNTWINSHVLFQPGFLFGYKGHLRMLDAIARLKPHYPDIHYVIQGSENPRMMPEHESLLAMIYTRCKELGIESNVTVNVGFVSTDVLLSHIRTCRAVVLPYITHPNHDVRATSGIARLVMATETPLIVSPVHLFDDVQGETIVAVDDESLAFEIEQVFDGYRVVDKNARLMFLKETSWPVVSKEYVMLYDAFRC